ncbi:MAG TPA: zinc ribbon domain-containing protein [Gemmatimonadaceae bacterium]|nr:zinc ribbon domain-containing protein [Gemmatimonadaceae bacterium]
MDDLDRMFRSLLQVMSSNYPQYLTQPFEVAEIYQNLIPYRHHRRELRIDTNEDYQAALCRLLSGERGYLVADDELTEAMRSELASPNPNTAIFRDFAASRVALGPNAQKRWQELGGDTSELRAAGESRGTPVPPPPPPISWNDGGERSQSSNRAATQTAPQAAAPAPRPAPAAAPRPAAATRTAGNSSAARASNEDGESCRYCAGELPEGRSAKFCPHCGQNLTIQRCPACGTELEIDWKYCITCGRGVAAS